MSAVLEPGLTCAAHLAFVQAATENMAPDFSRHDVVVYRRDMPRYLGDGFYVLDQLGMPSVWRVQGVGGGRLRVSQNLDWAEAWMLSADEFSGLCRGMVVGVIKVLDPEMIRLPVVSLSPLPIPVRGTVH